MTTRHGPRHGHLTDFDFLTGSWDVSHRRLVERWVGSDDWDCFDGTTTCEPRLGGVANVEQGDFPSRGCSGLALRLFDPTARQWSIYWVDSGTGRLEPPVVGGFDGSVGIFEGIDTDQGRSIRVRFTWTVIDADHARWEQAFSAVDGEWETNWTMDFSRRGTAR
jgi:hypothetical protein